MEPEGICSDPKKDDDKKDDDKKTEEKDSKKDTKKDESKKSSKVQETKKNVATLAAITFSLTNASGTSEANQKAR